MNITYNVCNCNRTYGNNQFGMFEIMEVVTWNFSFFKLNTRCVLHLSTNSVENVLNTLCVVHLSTNSVENVLNTLCVVHLSTNSVENVLFMTTE